MIAEINPLSKPVVLCLIFVRKQSKKLNIYLENLFVTSLLYIVITYNVLAVRL
jgi:hypothetical protein